MKMASTIFFQTFDTYCARLVLQFSFQAFFSGKLLGEGSELASSLKSQFSTIFEYVSRIKNKN